MFLVVLLYAIFGFSFTLGKMMVVHAHPLFAVGIRMLTGGIILLAWAFTRTKPRCYPQKSDLKYYALLTIFAIFIPYSLRLWALQEVSTMKAALLFNTAPFFTALAAVIFTCERINRFQVFSLFVGFAGTIPILLTGSPTEDIISWGFLSIYELALILSAASMGASFLITHQLVKYRGCPPYLANGMSTFFGGALAFGSSALLEPHPIKTSFGCFATVMLVQLILSNIICSNLQASLLKRYSPTFISFAGFLAPLFASIYGVVLFGERFSWHFFASFVLIGLGLGLYALGERKKRHIYPYPDEPPVNQ
ncbi:MAG: DMT family transporter [Candidatus Dependentiae bacterium]|nr:DMT family transporter [Candidatus Dependentiae bacterium]